MDKKIQVKNLLVLSAFSLYLITFFLIQNSTLNLIPNLSVFSQMIKKGYLICSIFFIVFFNEYNKKQIIYLIIIFIPLLISRIFVGVSPLLELFIFVTGLKSLPLKKIIKTFFVTQCISFVSILSLFFLSVIPDRIVIREGIMRSSLGFWHPNTVGMVLLSLFILSVFSEKKLTRLLLKIAIFNAMSSIFYGLTSSRTSLILILAVSCLCLLEYFLQERNFLFVHSRLFIPITFVVLLFLSLLSSELYLLGNNQLIKLNTLFSNRISIGSRFINEYGLTFWGQPIEYNSPNYYAQEIVNFQYKVLDNIYLKYLLNYGVVSVGLLWGYLYNISRVLNRYYLKYWNVYFLIFLIFGLMEQAVFNVGTNFLLLFGVLLLDKKENKEFVR